VEDHTEAFRVRHKDLMFLVSQRQREEEVKVEEKKALFERVVRPTTIDDNDNDNDNDTQKQRPKGKKKEKQKRKER